MASPRPVNLEGLAPSEFGLGQEHVAPEDARRGRRRSSLNKGAVDNRGAAAATQEIILVPQALDDAADEETSLRESLKLDIQAIHGEDEAQQADKKQYSPKWRSKTQSDSDDGSDAGSPQSPPFSLSPTSGGGSPSPNVRKRLVNSASFTSGRRYSRLFEMHAMHKEKLERQKQQSREKEEQELQQIKVSKELAKTGTRRSLDPSKLNPKAASVRLYNGHFETQVRLHEKKLYYEEQAQYQLEEDKISNLPTLRYASFSPSSETFSRLYEDAERRDRDKQMAKEAYDLALMKELQMQPSFGSTATANSTRHNDLYEDAYARRERLEQRQMEWRDEEKKRIEGGSVHAKIETPTKNLHQRLYDEYGERQRKRSVALAENQMRQVEECTRQYHANGRVVKGKRRRPSIIDDPRSPRSVRSVIRQEKQDAEAARRRKERWEKIYGSPTDNDQPQKKHIPVEQVLKPLVSAIQLRCDFKAQNLEKFVHRYSAPLTSAVKIFRDAHRQCEAVEGFPALVARQSQRILQERLLSDHEVWTRFVQPDPIKQVENDFESLLASAEKAQIELRELIAGQDWEPLTVRAHPDKLPIALFAEDPGVKSDTAAKAKAIVRYGPAEGPNCFRHVLDYARVLLVFATCELLQAGLDQILARFEVVDVRNYFSTPGRLGFCFVDVYVVVHVGEGQQRHPHVCEIRLEESRFHKAHTLAKPHLKKFLDKLCEFFPNEDPNVIHQIANTVMIQPSFAHDLRIFRCKFVKHFGSSICGWRRVLGSAGNRLVNFQKFREVCNNLNLSEYAIQFFEHMDATRAGCLSLYDFAPDAVALLLKFRRCLVALAEVAPECETDGESIFMHLAFLARPASPGHLEQHEFRVLAKPLGLTTEEADKLFTFLDYYGGHHHAPPATITPQDVSWLMRLPKLVDFDAVTLIATQSPDKVPCTVDQDHIESAFAKAATKVHKKDSPQHTANHSPKSTSFSPAKVVNQRPERGLLGGSGDSIATTPTTAATTTPSPPPIQSPAVTTSSPTQFQPPARENTVVRETPVSEKIVTKEPLVSEKPVNWESVSEKIVTKEPPVSEAKTVTKEPPVSAAKAVTKEPSLPKVVIHKDAPVPDKAEEVLLPTPTGEDATVVADDDDGDGIEMEGEEEEYEEAEEGEEEYAEEEEEEEAGLFDDDETF